MPLEDKENDIGDNERKVEHLAIRLNSDEKQAFIDAATVAGIPLSVWVRERLRQAAIKELDSVGHPIAFFKRLPWAKGR